MRHVRAQPALGCHKHEDAQQQEEGDEDTEDPGQVAHVAGDDDGVGATELASGRGWDSHGTEADVDGVTDDGDDGGLDLGDTQRHEHGAGDGNGNAEASQFLYTVPDLPGTRSTQAGRWMILPASDPRCR